MLYLGEGERLCPEAGDAARIGCGAHGVLEAVAEERPEELGRHAHAAHDGENRQAEIPQEQWPFEVVAFRVAQGPFTCESERFKKVRSTKCITPKYIMAA